MKKLQLNPPESVLVTQSDVELLEQHRKVGSFGSVGLKVSPLLKYFWCVGESAVRGFVPSVWRPCCTVAFPRLGNHAFTLERGTSSHC